MDDPETTPLVTPLADEVTTNLVINLAAAALRETFGLPFVLWENPQAWRPVFIESNAVVMTRGIRY